MEQAVKTPRQSNFELCRIICMVFIIAHHCILHGGAYVNTSGLNYLISLSLFPQGKLFYLSFVAISTWFLAGRTFQTKRFLKIWLEVLIYSVIFTVVAWIYGVEMRWQDWLGILFPISGNSHGFASGYLILYLLVPFLNKLVYKLNQFQTLIFVSVLLYATVLSSVFGAVIDYYHPFYSQILLFILCYFLSYYLRHWMPAFCKKKLLMLSLVLFTILFRMLVQHLETTQPGMTGLSIMLRLCYDEASLFTIIGGYAFFLFFLELRVPLNKTINWVAPTTFGILLIHDHNFFRPIVWNTIFQCADWWNSPFFGARVAFCVVMLFICGALIDKLRVFLLEEPLFALKPVNRFCSWFDAKINAQLE